MTTMFVHMTPRLGAAAALVALAACAGAKSGPTPRPAEQFDTPQRAVDSLVAAAARLDLPRLKAILGSEGEALVETGDDVLARKYLTEFATQARMRQHVELDSTGTSATLLVGAGDWPMPAPIVKRDGQWAFDAAQGLEEVVARRIGRNELDAIEVCRGYVEAQFAYAAVRHDGARVNQYAQRVSSTPGKQDGLAWRAPDGSWQGPVGEGVARAIAEGYSARYEPFHGYLFKVLKGQGPSAPLGQIDFVVEGAMIGGFALVAAPAEYLVSGVKTFIVSHDGIVYEKDLGDRTLDAFRAMERYDPDSTWTRVSGW